MGSMWGSITRRFPLAKGSTDRHVQPGESSRSIRNHPYLYGKVRFGGWLRSVTLPTYLQGFYTALRKRGSTGVAILLAGGSIGVANTPAAMQPPKIGLPQGETFTIISPKKRQRCHRVFTWNHRVVGRRCVRGAR